MVLRAYGSTDATVGGGKVRKPGGGRGNGNGKGPNGGGGAGSVPWANVISLLHFDGTNGSTTFTDEKGTVWAVTGSVPAPEISTGLSKFGGSSLLVPLGATRGISASAVTGSVLETQDFCMECFFYPVTGGAASGWIATKSYTSGASRASYGLLFGSSANKVAFYASKDSATYQVAIESDSTLSLDTWHHLAAVRVSGVWAFYVDGTRQSTTVTEASNWGTVSTDFTLYIADSVLAGAPSGHSIDEFRLVIGYPVYTGATITVPTSAFPNS